MKEPSAGAEQKDCRSSMQRPLDTESQPPSVLANRSGRRRSVPVIALLALSLLFASCVSDPEHDGAGTPSAATTVPDGDPPPTETAATDWTGEWWYRTYGDAEVVASESKVGFTLNRFEERDGYTAGWTTEAVFASQEGVAALKTVAGWPEGRDEETIELTSAEYADLWQRVIDTGWVAEAMSGADSGSFGDSNEAYLVGAAGPQGLGWTVSSTRQKFESSPSAGRLLALLQAEATARSSVFRRGLELVDGAEATP